MIFKKIIFIPVCLYILSFTLQDSFAQSVTQKIDSLKQNIAVRKNIYEKLDLLNQLSDLYNKVNLDSALTYSDIAMEILRSKNIPNSFPTVYYERGVIFKNKGIIDSAQYYLFKALKLFENKNDLGNMIRTNIAIGEFYRSTHTLGDAVKFIKRAIHLSKDKHIYTYLPSAYNRLGATIFEMAFIKSNININADRIHAAIQYVDTSFLWSRTNKTDIYNLSNYNTSVALFLNYVL